MFGVLIILADTETLQKHKARKKLGSLYENLNYRERENRFYIVVFIVRRILLAIFCTMLQKHSGI